ncbi:MAG: transposase [Desulfobaccales bacterium]
MERPPHYRRSLRLKDYDYRQSGAYFVTICVKDRKYLLGSITDGEARLSTYGSIVANCWLWLSSGYSYLSLDEWTIMPNHLHGIIFIYQPNAGGSRTAPTIPKPLPLSRLVGAFKTVSSKYINIVRQTLGAPFWQRGFYEHVIRHEEALNRIRNYIATNPVRWELDRENQQATGKDDFDDWLTKFHQKPTTKAIVL